MKYRVRLTPGDGGELIEADHYTLDAGGSLVLWDGHLFEPRLVRAYAPTGWHSVTPEPEAPPAGPYTSDPATRTEVTPTAAELLAGHCLSCHTPTGLAHSRSCRAPR